MYICMQICLNSTYGLLPNSNQLILFRKMLELGKELPWYEALEVLTGSNKLSSKPLIEYFKPFEDWLDTHRNKRGYTLGWDNE